MFSAKAGSDLIARGRWFAQRDNKGYTRALDMLRLGGLLLCLSCVVAAAQTTVPRGSDHPGSACPPGVGADGPTVGKEQNRSLSDQLAQSKGVICPPAGVDPEMRQKPPAGGTLKVVPPPGSPGGNPGVQPK
jgi:hypothetical protein